MSRRSYSGSAVKTTLSAGISSSAMTAQVAALDGYPDPVGGPFVVTIARGTPDEEKALVESYVGTTVTFSQRGFDGTVAAAHSSGDDFEHTFSAKDADEANDHVNKTTNIHGLGPSDGALVGTQKGQTFVNKSISGVDNVLSDIPGAAVPDFISHREDEGAHGVSGEVVGTTSTQTLTGKTMDGSSNTFQNVPISAVSELQTVLDAKAPAGVVDALATHAADVSAHGVSTAVVGIGDTQTLTNKTLTGAVLNGGAVVENPAGTYKALEIKAKSGAFGDLLRISGISGEKYLGIDLYGDLSSDVQGTPFGLWVPYLANVTGFTTTTRTENGRYIRLGKTIIGYATWRMDSITALGSSVIEVALPVAVTANFDSDGLGWKPIGQADFRVASGAYVTGHCYVTGGGATKARLRLPIPGGSTPNLGTLTGVSHSIAVNDSFVLNYIYETDL